MAELVYEAGFADDLALVYSEKLRHEVSRLLDAIELFGDIGSRDVPVYLLQTYGEGIRKAPVGPFDLIYLVDEDNDIAYIRALIHQKTVR